MALILQGEVIGRARRETERGYVITILVRDGLESYKVAAYDVPALDIPAVGEIVSVPVRVRAFATKNGAGHTLVLQRDTGSFDGESF